MNRDTYPFCILNCSGCSSDTEDFFMAFKLASIATKRIIKMNQQIVGYFKNTLFVCS